MERETKPRIKRRKLSKLRNKHGSQKMEKQLKFLRATTSLTPSLSPHLHPNTWPCLTLVLRITLKNTREL